MVSASRGLNEALRFLHQLPFHCPSITKNFTKFSRFISLTNGGQFSFHAFQYCSLCLCSLLSFISSKFAEQEAWSAATILRPNWLALRYPARVAPRRFRVPCLGPPAGEELWRGRRAASLAQVPAYPCSRYLNPSPLMQLNSQRRLSMNRPGDVKRAQCACAPAPGGGARASRAARRPAVVRASRRRAMRAARAGAVSG